MKTPKDNFSKQASSYKKFRPEYPKALYTFLLSLVENTDVAWDCGTGNGQVAKVLGTHFRQVEASDISASQLAQAEPSANIRYSIQQAEATDFPDNYFDLITVAQAAHWFDLTAFNKEVRRVAKPGALLAVWGYSLLRIDPEIDALIDHLYTVILGKYWDPERRHVDRGYSSLSFDIQSIPVDADFDIKVQWTRQDLEGYLQTWSSRQHYLKTHKDDPINHILTQLRTIWPEHLTKEVYFPVFMKIGRI